MYRVLLVLVVAACAQSPQQRTEEVCNAFCDCAVGPASVQTCIDHDCIPALPQGVSDTCFDCVNQHEASCNSLETSCMQTCFQAVQP